MLNIQILCYQTRRFMYNTIINTVTQRDDQEDRFGFSFKIKFLPNTILTLEIITKFIQEFYDKVILLTDSTIKFSIYVRFPHSIGPPYS